MAPNSGPKALLCITAWPAMPSGVGEVQLGFGPSGPTMSESAPRAHHRGRLEAARRSTGARLGQSCAVRETTASTPGLDRPREGAASDLSPGLRSSDVAALCAALTAAADQPGESDGYWSAS